MTTGKFSISYSISPYPISRKCPEIYSGIYNNKNSIFKFYKNMTEAEEFHNNFEKLGCKNYVPCFEGPFNLKHNSFSVTTCFKITYTSILTLFVSKRKEFSELKGNINEPKIWMPFVISTYRKVFNSVVSGLLQLFRYGITVPNLRNNCTVISEEDGNYRVAFLKLTSFRDSCLVNSVILELVSLMKDVAGLTGPRFDHPSIQMPEDIYLFLMNVDLSLLNFMNDPEFVLNDPFTYTLQEKYKRITEMNMFIQTCPFRYVIDAYSRYYPSCWNEWIKPSSFIGEMIRDWNEKKAKESDELTEKVHLEDVLEKVKRNLEKGLQCKKIHEVKEYMRMGLDESERECIKSGQADHSLLAYYYSKGFIQVPKISRNSTQHYNDHAKACQLPLETLDSIVEKVDDAFDCTCAHLHWFFVYVWRNHIPMATEIDIQKSIFLGQNSWNAVKEDVCFLKENAIEDGKQRRGPPLDSCDEGEHKKPKLERTGWTAVEPSEANSQQAIPRKKVSFKFKKGPITK